MNPDQQQQPNQPYQPPEQPVNPPYPAQPPAPQYLPPQPVQPPTVPQPQYQPAAPQTPSSYETPQQNFDANYLDSIAPPPPRPNFFSGSFGKIFIVLMALFVLAVSIIVASSGTKKTADLEQISYRVTAFGKIAQSEQRYIKSNNLSTTNSQFQAWQGTAQKDAEILLKQAGVKQSQFDKKMKATEDATKKKLTDKFENARLNVSLDRVYAGTMAIELTKLINLYDIMAKKSAAKAIREYAKTASANLKPIQKSFDSYIDDGN